MKPPAAAPTRIAHLSWVVLLLIFAVTTAGCSPEPPRTTSADSPKGDPTTEKSTTITVSAATSLKRAFEETALGFRDRTGIRVELNFASSGVLQRQIEGGAPVDVFASASDVQMEALESQRLVMSRTVETFVSNATVLAVPADSTLGLDSFDDLTGTDVRIVTTGNPETAPHGSYSVEVLASLRILDRLEDKMVYAANSAQTLDYVARGEADAGLIFLSETTGREDVRVVADAPANAHRPMRYMIAVTESADDVEPAKMFIDFVLSAEGQRILKAHGFSPIDTAEGFPEEGK